MSEQIRIYMAAGEGEREKGIRRAMKGDKRFAELEVRSGLPVDLQFVKLSTCGHCGLTRSHKCTNCYDYDGRLSGKYFNVELKVSQDFIQSVLNGHLQEQTLAIRETGQDGCTVILGGMDDIYQAIDESSKKRLIELPGGKKKTKILNDDERKQANATTLARCKSFKKRSMLNGVPVFWKGDDSGFFDGDDQFKDILDLAHDYLCDGDMMGFRMRPAAGERELLAASILFHGDGIGPGVLKPVMKEYDLVLVPKGDFARQPCDMPGIGAKRSAMIDSRIVMAYGFRGRA